MFDNHPLLLTEIEVMDENDNRPQIEVEAIGGGAGHAPLVSAFPAEVQLSVREGTPEGSRLAIVSVADADSGPNGKVNCSVDRGADAADGAGRGQRSDGSATRPAVAALQPMPFEHRFYLVTGATFDRERLGVFEADAEPRAGDEVALRFRIGTSGCLRILYAIH